MIGKPIERIYIFYSVMLGPILEIIGSIKHGRVWLVPGFKYPNDRSEGIVVFFFNLMCYSVVLDLFIGRHSQIKLPHLIVNMPFGQLGVNALEIFA